MTVPDPLLERFRQGELSPAEHAALEASLTEEDRARLSELDASDAEILERYPPRVMAIAIQDKARRQSRRWVLPTVGSAVVLLGAAAAIAVVVSQDPSATASYGGLERGVSADGSIRAKGDTRVLVYAETRPDEPLADNAPVARGDVLQLALNAGEDTHAVLVSVDGAGVVTTHLPRTGGEAAPVEPGRTVALPHAYTLDDAPAFERFFLVTSDAPFTVDEVRQAARRVATSAEPDAAPLPVSDDLSVTDHIVRKVSR